MVKEEEEEEGSALTDTRSGDAEFARVVRPVSHGTPGNP